MDKIIIAIAYILTFLFFGILIKIRKKNEKKFYPLLYVLIILIVCLIIIWDIFRNI